MRNPIKKGLKQQSRKAVAKQRIRKPLETEPLNIEEVNLSPTKHGIEMSFDKHLLQDSREPSQTVRRPEPVISIKEQIRKRQRVHRTQFSVSFPALPSPSSSTDIRLDNWGPKDHRIPLLGISAPESSYEDVLNLLQHNQASTEYMAVKKEIEKLSSEISALEKDRSWLDTKRKNMLNSPSSSFSPSKPNGPVVDWDVRKVLDSTGLGDEERKKLQLIRGNCLTISIQNPRAKEVFLSKCGFKQSYFKSSKRTAPGDTITLGAQNCRSGGAGSSVRHVTLMNNTHGSKSAFFFSRDNGKAQTWGHLPPKLYRRMKGSSSSGSQTGDLVYLSTGPHGSYYAEFKSGECCWGSAIEDRDFHNILQAWDVYRVVFGPIEMFEDERGNTRATNSWIILGRDGRAAWKNLPSRLHNRLESRLANWAAPAEVALGPGDSYFVRFLDGSVDYCLPAEVAKVCEYIERHGGSITDIALHPDISHDYVIRHTELR